MKNLIFKLSILAITIISCDPALHSKKIIRNESDHNVWIAIKDTTSYMHHFESDSFMIMRNSEVLIWEINGLGRIDNEARQCNFYSDSIITGIENNDSLNLLIDLTNSSNWNYVEIDKYSNGGGEYECRLTIKNDHIK